MTWSQVIEPWPLAPYEEQLQQAESMPGWQRRAAQDAVAETGVDMTKDPYRAVTWLLGLAAAPRWTTSPASARGRSKAKKGNRYLGAITGETAVVVGLHPDPRRRPATVLLARRRGTAQGMRRSPGTLS